MQRPLLINLGLLAMAGLLILIVWLEPGLEPASDSEPLTSLVAAEVQTLTLTRLAKDPLVFTRDRQGAWHMQTPFALPANQFHIEIALNLLSEHNYQPLAGALDLAEVQLEPALLTLEFDETRFALGDLSPLGDGQRYLRYQEQNYLVVDRILPFINNEATSFLDLFLVQQGIRITELVLPDYHLVSAETGWQLTTELPEASVATLDTRPDALNTLIDNWQRAQALSVRGYTQTSETEGTIRVSLANGKTLNFAILETSPDLMLALPEQGVSYHLAPRQVKKLLSLPSRP